MQSQSHESAIAIAANDTLDTETLHVERDRIESMLRQPIFVEKYPGRVGEVLEGLAGAQNCGYSSYNHDKNLYAPFAHRFDWEIA